MPTPAPRHAESPEFGERAVDELLFDPQNPRLPVGTVVRKASADESQRAILEYFRGEGNLDELARSYADNGYFKTEPLIVTRDGAPNGKFVVLEGNRRLAALQLLLGGQQDDLRRLDVQVDAALRRALKNVPVLTVARRDEATAMIGFRHIGGLKLWDSDAKARWIAHHVDAAKQVGDPFGHVARTVGMPRTQIRYYYLAARLADVARDEEKYDIQKLTQYDRFGVFLRALENPQIRAHIGLGDVGEYRDAVAAVRQAAARPAALCEVLDDIAKPDLSGKFVVGDSRNVPKYGEILAHPEARQALRAESFEAAQQALAPIALADEVRRVRRNVERLRGKLDTEKTLTEEVIEGVKEIQRVARGLRTTAN
ncbi:MAG: hypothetical protein HY908_08410 [Myxococcales bacterium]|nr:hypothetical protein [Myxococcales bacterium]